MNDFSDARVLITGVSGQLGFALSQQLAALRCRLILTGKCPERLARTAAVVPYPKRVRVAVMDPVRSNQAQELVEIAWNTWDGLDAIVNLADPMQGADFAEQSSAEIERRVNGNLRAAGLLSRAVLPRLVRQGSGTIMNVGSAVGSGGFPSLAYSASRFALRCFSQALRRELKGTGVSVMYRAVPAMASAAPQGTVMGLVGRTTNPVWNARRIVDAISGQPAVVNLEWPEWLFNSLDTLRSLPILGATRGQFAGEQGFVSQARRFAKEAKS